MAKKELIFECEHCGNIQNKWLGKCPECGAFGSFLEIKKKDLEVIRQNSLNLKKNSATPIDEVKIKDFTRFDTGEEEFNLVLGGGVVEASLILIGGNPGVGKSTLLLKVASNLAKKYPVLYISGEESLSQIKSRAIRLNAINKNLFLLNEINFSFIKDEIYSKNYKFIIIDSIQTLFSDEISSSPGSVSQIKDITFNLMRIAKEQNITIFVIGHITKDGSLAGPKILEHMVDVVLYFEGDSSKEARFLRGFKNRFGSNNEVGIFHMQNDGLVSANFFKNLSFKKSSSSGSAVSVTMQGSRPMIVEIQALVAESNYPKRALFGYDKNRLDIIIALLDKKMGLKLSGYDVFINVIGGIKINEPACDLAVVAAIISSFKNRVISNESVFIGEVSLNGEIKDVPFLDLRLNEAKKQNFKNAIISNKPLKNQGLKIFNTDSISKIIDWM